MRVLVCGGRDYADRDAVCRELDALTRQHGWLTVIEGGAKGADRLAREWARTNLHGVLTVEADWKTHGRAAGPIRNNFMAVVCKPDLVLAFPSPERGLVGTGTGDMVRRARDAGVEVMFEKTWRGPT